MAIVLRSNTDLVYLPDHGFVGDEGGESSPPTPSSARIHCCPAESYLLPPWSSLYWLRSLTRSHPALRILPLVTRQIRRIDISHNLLGSDGVETLFKGLSVLRSRYSSPEAVWGLTEINLGCNTISDEALDVVLAYAKKDVCLRKVYLQANDIEVGPLRTSLQHPPQHPSPDVSLIAVVPGMLPLLMWCAVGCRVAALAS